MDIALLIVDMQNGCREGCRCKEVFDGAVKYINEAARMCREKGAPVVIVQHLGLGRGPGSQEYDVVSSVNRSDGDVVLQKTFSNAFCRTGLGDMLRGKGVKFVVVSGYAAEYCVEFTCNGAIEEGFAASLLQKGVAGTTEEGGKSAQLLRPVVSLQALEYMLSKQ